MPAGYFIIGDSGYGLSDWLMVPYPASACAQPFETSFNFAFYSTRIVVEQAFGRLKMRWRVLLGEQQENPQTAARVAIACMVLHNLASESPDSAFRASWSTPVDSVGTSNAVHNSSHTMAARRSAIAGEIYDAEKS